MSYVRTVRRRISDEPVRRSLFRILRENVLCSISTVTQGHRAHINTAYWCCSRDLEFYFLSDPTSVHCRNLKTNSSMAVTIFRSSQKWGTPNRGIQLFGTCREATGRLAKKAERLYERRFPLYAKWMRGRGAEDRRLTAQLRSYRFYRFLPMKVKILDESEFGGAVNIIAALDRARRSK